MSLYVAVVEADAKDVNDSISVVHETRRERCAAINTKGSVRVIGPGVISPSLVLFGFSYGCLASRGYARIPGQKDFERIEGGRRARLTENRNELRRGSGRRRRRNRRDENGEGERKDKKSDRLDEKRGEKRGEEGKERRIVSVRGWKRGDGWKWRRGLATLAAGEDGTS